MMMMMMMITASLEIGDQISIQKTTMTATYLIATNHDGHSNDN